VRVPGGLSGRARAVVFDQRGVNGLRKRTVVRTHTPRARVQPNLNKAQRVGLVLIIFAVADTTAGSLFKKGSKK